MVGSEGLSELVPARLLVIICIEPQRMSEWRVIRAVNARFRRESRVVSKAMADSSVIGKWIGWLTLSRLGLMAVIRVQRRPCDECLESMRPESTLWSVIWRRRDKLLTIHCCLKTLGRLTLGIRRCSIGRDLPCCYIAGTKRKLPLDRIPRHTILGVCRLQI